MPAVMIAISGKWFRAQDQLLARSRGFDHFIEKPAEPREVAPILHGVRQWRLDEGNTLTPYARVGGRSTPLLLRAAGHFH